MSKENQVKAFHVKQASLDGKVRDAKVFAKAMHYSHYNKYRKGIPPKGYGWKHDNVMCGDIIEYTVHVNGMEVPNMPKIRLEVFHICSYEEEMDGMVEYWLR